jgi:hypothetical protein
LTTPQYRNQSLSGESFQLVDAVVQIRVLDVSLIPGDLTLHLNSSGNMKIVQKIKASQNNLPPQ